MDEEEQRRLSRGEQRRLVTALRIALLRCQQKGWDPGMYQEAFYEANVGLEPRNLAQIRTLLKLACGYDPIAQGSPPGEEEGASSSPEAEEEPKRGGSEAREPPSLQDLTQRIYAKAKADFGWRRWSTEWLYETLGLFKDYRVLHRETRLKAKPCP